jgi:ADP-ribosylglycohydrolase
MAAMDRALGALYGLAIGDALGMPTQGLPRSRVSELFGRLDGFRAGPPENEVSTGLPAGHTTDDTDQALIVGELLVEGNGRVDLHRFADRLREWQDLMRRRGSADLLGPSTLRALDLLDSGADPTGRTGRWGDTDGAAMRVTPVGVAVPASPLGTLCETVADLDRLTHDTTVANAGACAVAAVVSAGVGGCSWAEALPFGLAAAAEGAGHGWYVPGADVGRRISWALGVVAGADDETLLDRVDGLVGTGVATQEAVPAAFAVASRSPDDPWRAALLAARLGGDSDTVAAMAAAMVGACTGRSALPDEAVATVRQVNDLHLEPLADGLLALRGAA